MHLGYGGPKWGRGAGGIAAGRALVTDSLTGDTNNYAPAGLPGAAELWLDSTQDIDLTGLTGGSAGRILTIGNRGSFLITLPHESPSSDAENRFFYGDGVALTVPPQGAYKFYWSGTLERWTPLETAVLPKAITPPTVTGVINDYAPIGIYTADVIILTPTGDFTLTGLAGGSPGRTIRLVNTGPFTGTLLNEDAGSLPNNRFTLASASIPVGPGLSVPLYYDATSRWVPQTDNGTGVPTLNQVVAVGNVTGNVVAIDGTTGPIDMQVSSVSVFKLDSDGDVSITPLIDKGLVAQTSGLGAIAITAGQDLTLRSGTDRSITGKVQGTAGFVLLKHFSQLGVTGAHLRLGQPISGGTIDQFPWALPYQNTSGGSLAYGDIVVFDPAADDSVTTSTTPDDPLVAGAVVVGGAAGATVWVARGGKINVVVRAFATPISPGDMVTTSGTAKQGQKIAGAGVLGSIVGKALQPANTNGQTIAIEVRSG